MVATEKTPAWSARLVLSWNELREGKRRLQPGELEAARERANELLNVFDDLIVDLSEDASAAQRAEKLLRCAAYALETAAGVSSISQPTEAFTQAEMLERVSQRFNHWQVNPFDTASSDYWKTALSMHLTAARATLNDLEDDTARALDTLNKLGISLAADVIAAALLADPGPIRGANLNVELDKLEEETIRAAADLAASNPDYPQVGKGSGDAIQAALQAISSADILQREATDMPTRMQHLTKLRTHFLRASACELLEIETIDVERDDPVFSGQRTIMTAALDQATQRISWLPLISNFQPFEYADGCRLKILGIASTFGWICRGLRNDRDGIRFAQGETVRQLGNSIMALWVIDREREGEPPVIAAPPLRGRQS
jgi:hypothetical protein